MTQEEFAKLNEKVSAGKASPAEKLALIKEMSAAIEDIRGNIASLRAKQTN